MPAFRKIIVGTDFSPDAARALRWAIELAGVSGGRITLVHGIHTIATTSLPLEIQRQLDRSLAEVESIVREADVPVTSVYREGRPWEVIRDIEQESGADLVLIGARGSSPGMHARLGSTADRIIRAAKAPVLTVPDGDGALQVETVLVAVDFSRTSDAAVELAADLLETFGTGRRRLVLVHAWQPLVQYGIESVDGGGQVFVNLLDDREEQAQSMLSTKAQALARPDLDVHELLRQGHAAAVIQREAETLQADLIAMGTHGREGLEHFMMGSVAEKVLHHAPCAVLTVKRRPEP